VPSSASYKAAVESSSVSFISNSMGYIAVNHPIVRDTSISGMASRPCASMSITNFCLAFWSPPLSLQARTRAARKISSAVAPTAVPNTALSPSPSSKLTYWALPSLSATYPFSSQSPPVPCNLQLSALSVVIIVSVPVALAASAAWLHIELAHVVYLIGGSAMGKPR